jgi:hypothetical protein
MMVYDFASPPTRDRETELMFAWFLLLIPTLLWINALTRE